MPNIFSRRLCRSVHLLLRILQSARQFEVRADELNKVLGKIVVQLDGRTVRLNGIVSASFSSFLADFDRCGMVLTQISSARSRTTGVNTIARYATAASILETFQCSFFLGFHEACKGRYSPVDGERHS